MSNLLSDRLLPNWRVRATMLAIQEVMGRNELTASLRLAGLQRYIGAMPPATSQSELRASEYSALIQAIETQFGSGARGQLNRVGHASFKHIRTAEALRWRWLDITRRFLPPAQRLRRALNQLAKQLAGPEGTISLRLAERRLIFVDEFSDNTFGRQRYTEICWLTVGQLQACCVWATGKDYEVAEVSCKAKGNVSCNFEISEL